MLMAMFMKETGLMIRLMVEADILIQMEQYMKVNGIKISNMVTV